jgi:hypothetical protein
MQQHAQALVYQQTKLETPVLCLLTCITPRECRCAMPVAASSKRDSSLACEATRSRPVSNNPHCCYQLVQPNLINYTQPP